MNARAFDFFMDLDAVHARLRHRLDEELGLLHGLSFIDFRLLQALAQAGPEGCDARQLESPLGLARSAVLRQVLPLEKSGWVERSAVAPGASGAPGPTGGRRIRLRAPGHRLCREATETATRICGAELSEAIWAEPAFARGLAALNPVRADRASAGAIA